MPKQTTLSIISSFVVLYPMVEVPFVSSANGSVSLFWSQYTGRM